MSSVQLEILNEDGSKIPMVNPADAPYDDETGAEDGTVIALLKAIYMKLVEIEVNTTPV